MTIPKEIIELAVSGGWHKDDTVNIAYWIKQGESFPEKVVCDSAFWQALGSALAWREFNRCPVCRRVPPKGFDLKEYEHQAHRFYDLILTNQPTDIFWEELLAQ